MKSPTLKTAEQWRKEHPGHKALILSPAARDKPNTSFILNKKEPAPEGLFRFLGVIG